MEIAAARRHYHAPLTRTINPGKPPEKIVALTDTIVEGVDTAPEAAIPGATCEQVEAAWQNVLPLNGYKKESRVGYSIGLNFPPDWGEHGQSPPRRHHRVASRNVFSLSLRSVAGVPPEVSP